MSESGSKNPGKPKAAAPVPKKNSVPPRPAMKANEKLIGRAIIGSGAIKR